MDAKDILGLPRTGFPTPQEKKFRPPKDSQRKPDGISREVYALTGGMAPLMPSLDISYLKRRAQTEKEKITWQWLPFTSSARTDNLQLYHWVRVVNGVPPTGDYAFAKYNKSVDILKYTDEEYDKHLVDPAWTKEETDQLFDLCERFDLRFIVIADRFSSSKSVEELKGRYYAVSRALLIARAPSAGDVATDSLVKDPYNFSQDVERKRALSTMWSQTKQQEQKDNEILAEAKRIMESRIVRKKEDAIRQKKADGEADLVATTSAAPEINEKSATRDDSVSPTSYAQLSAAGAALAVDVASVPPALRTLRVYLRTTAFEQMVQASSSSAGLRAIKRVEQTLQDLGVHVKPKVPTKAVCSEHLELRRDILTLLTLQKQVQYKEVESSGRDRGSVETPCTPKRSIGGGDQDRPFIPDSVSFGGEKAGKRDHKRKGPGRFSDTPPSPPQSKRPRKLKASDG